MQIHDFETMYIAGLQEARSLEELMVAALPTFVDAADDAELRELFRIHHAEARIQLERVKAILDGYHASASGGTAGAVEALVAAAENVTATQQRGALRDATLIALAQRIEHLEMAAYGTLAAYAKLLGRHDEKRVLGAILEEERAHDQDLTDIADAIINPRAATLAAPRIGGGPELHVAAA